MEEKAKLEKTVKLNFPPGIDKVFSIWIWYGMRWKVGEIKNSRKELKLIQTICTVATIILVVFNYDLIIITNCVTTEKKKDHLHWIKNWQFRTPAKVRAQRGETNPWVPLVAVVLWFCSILNVTSCCAGSDAEVEHFAALPVWWGLSQHWPKSYEIMEEWR